MKLNLRRMAAASGLVAVTLFIAACGPEQAVDNDGIVAAPTSAAPSAPDAASPTASAPAAGGGTASGAAARTDSKAESCRKADKAKADMAKILVGATGAGGAAGYGKALAQLGTDLTAVAATAADPAVASALQEVATTASAVAASKNPLTADQSAFGKAGGKLEAACAA